MNKRVLQIPAYISGYKRKKDMSMSIAFGSTIEVDSDTIKDTDTFMNKEGWLLFSENEIQDSDVPVENAPIEGKTPSQRLHAVLYVLWNQLKDTGKKVPSDFQTYYNMKMDGIINHVKDKLPER